MKQQSPKKESTNKQAKRKKNETLNQKVRRHIEDENDIITDEDLRDVKVGTISTEQAEKSEELAVELTKKKNITPWEILDEEE